MAYHHRIDTGKRVGTPQRHVGPYLTLLGVAPYGELKPGTTLCVSVPGAGNVSANARGFLAKNK